MGRLVGAAVSDTGCSFGSKPGWKASSMPWTVRKTASFGLAKSAIGLPFSACCMKSMKIGTAATAPVSCSPSERLSSKPTNTPTTRFGE